MTPFAEVIQNVGVLDNMNVDNHTHGLSIRGIKANGNASFTNLAIDMLVVSKLNDPSLELIANCRLQPEIENSKVDIAQAKLTELLVINNIPNYLTLQGPYHPVIEEVRADKYLSDFRIWISQRPKHTSPQEILEMKQDIEQALQNAQEEVFLKNLNPKRHFTSVGKAMLGDALGLLFPLSGTVNAIAESTIDAANETSQYWQGFLVGARSRTKKALTQ